METSPAATCADVKHRAIAKISAIQERVDDLQRIKRALGRLEASCNENGPIDHCPIIECFVTSHKKDDSR